MAVVWRMLLLVLLVQKSIGQEVKPEKVQQAIHRVQNKVQQTIHRVQNALKAPTSRRLLITDIPDFSKMCNAGCWTKITSGMVTMYEKMESDPVCASARANDTECDGERRLNSTDSDQAPPSCMFDTMCTGDMGKVCDQIKDPAMLQKYQSSPGFNCSLPAIEWICNSICGAACQGDSEEERKLFCAPREESSSSDEEQNCDSGTDGDTMSDMFGFICSQSSPGVYCYKKGLEWVLKGAFKDPPGTERFPDVCEINCTTPTGLATQDLGCCMAGTTIGMTQSEQEAARAEIYVCGGRPAMEFCDVDGFLTIPQVTLIGARGVDTCPVSGTEEEEARALIASKLGVKWLAVRIITCNAISDCSGGRRLAEAANNMEYTVRVKGSAETLAAKQATITAKMKTLETETGGKVVVPATGKATGDGSALVSKAGQDSLGVSLGMLVVVSAIFK